MEALFALASFAGLAGFVGYATSNILNETLMDPFLRLPINVALVSTILKYMFVKYRKRYHEQIVLEDEEDEDIKEEEDQDGFGNSNDGGRCGS